MRYSALHGLSGRRRYAALAGLSATADDVKEYFDVSVYRNILDMLNTFESSVKGLWQEQATSIDGALWPSSVTRVFRAPIEGAAYGYAKDVFKITTLNSNMETSYKQFVAKMKAVADSAKGPAVSVAYGAPITLARSLEWEMNRVRLPTPANFRQFIASLTSLSIPAWYQVQLGYRAGGRVETFKAATLQELSRKPPTAAEALIYGDGPIKLVELFSRIKQVWPAINEMRAAVRREIDAANLAAKVQEETLRREQEELKNAREREEQAQAAALAILRQKEADYLAQYSQLQSRNIELSLARDQLLAEIKTLQNQIAMVSDPDQIDEINAAISDYARQVSTIDAQERELDKVAGALILAVQNISTENIELRTKIAQLDIQRNRVKSDAIREMESQLAEARQKAADALDLLQKEEQALLDKQRILDEEAAQAASAEEAARIAAEQAALQNQIDNNQILQNDILRTDEADEQAALLAENQQELLSAIDALNEQIIAAETQLAEIEAELLTVDDEQAAAALTTAAESLRIQLNELKHTADLLNVDLDKNKQAAAALESLAQPETEKKSFLPLLLAGGALLLAG